MACELKILFMVSIISLLANLQPLMVCGAPKVPCFFIMGDSLVDNGNNNGLSTTAKANYLPYGIDFPDGPTGRFTNGRNVADIIALLLDFDNYIPPFATARDQDILKGVNYGSGGAGIRDETGSQLGEVISLNKQLSNHQTMVSRIASRLGSKEAAANLLSKCIYSVGMGSNDYINNYLMPENYTTSSLYTPEHYAVVLIQQYSQQLKTLYNYGARKVALFGLGLIGCTPAELATYRPKIGCVDKINKDVQLFNYALKSLVDELNHNLTDAKFIYINVAEISSVVVLDARCCVSNLTSGLCVPNEDPCHDRNLHLFWDAFHPTEIANKVVAERAYNALTSSDAYPIDIRRLAEL